MSNGDLDRPMIGPNPDGHLHGFVFIDHTETRIQDVLTHLSGFRRAEFPRIRWAGSVIGDYLALVHFEVESRDDLGSMQDFVDETLWEKGVRCQHAAELATVNMKGTKKSTPDILSLVGIKAESGATRHVANQLARMDFESDGTLFKGASILNGHLDILLQLNDDSFIATQDRLFPEAEVPSSGDDDEVADLLAGIDGIAWTSTAVADGSRGPWSEAFPEEWETR